MICCLCGRRIDEGDVFIRITMHRLRRVTAIGEDISDRLKLEDGSPEKRSHPVCPVIYGAPLSLIGADRGYDV